MSNKIVSYIALSLISSIAVGIPSAYAMEINVTPPRFELDLKARKARSNSIKITNTSNQPVEMRAYVRNWKMDKNNRLEEAPSNERSLDQWIIFTPSRFRIEPGSTQSVRFEIRPKLEPSEGEYRAVIYLEEIVAKRSVKEDIQTIGRVGVVVYGYAGNVKRVGTVNSVNVDTISSLTKATFDISNQGKAHVRIGGQYAIWRAANYPGAKATRPIRGANNPDRKLPPNVVQVGKIDLPPVLPSDRRQLVLPIAEKLPPGNYILDLNGDLSGTAIDQGIPFTVPNTNVSTSTPKTINSDPK